MRSIEFRNSPLFLRNEFDTVGLWEFPLVKKQQVDYGSVELISCSDISYHDTINLNKGIHHFVDDYRFEKHYNNPDKFLSLYSKYRFVLTPDYSLYYEMNKWRQIESIGKSRWVGAKWQKEGLTVIPTVSWSQPSSFSFCFDGIEKHSIVAIGMIGCKHSRTSFMHGYNTMLDIIDPEAIICFGNPFPEMKGNVIAVDYNSSRRVARHGR